MHVISNRHFPVTTRTKKEANNIVWKVALIALWKRKENQPMSTLAWILHKGLHSTKTISVQLKFSVVGSYKRLKLKLDRVQRLEWAFC